MASSVAGICRPWPWRAWLALVLLAILPQGRAQVAVSESGQAVYSIPIPAPPGIAGHEPKLSLQYARGASGHLAAGWSIAGGSLITRCGSTMASDGFIKGVRYTSEDRFCLDGERLILTNADGVVGSQAGYGVHGSEYRTEKDAFSRVRAYGGSAALGPETFKVWTKSGLVYQYGATGDSRITTHGLPNAVVVTWAVNRISDAAHNYIDFSYRNQTSTFAGSGGREWWLSQVRYTGNEKRGQLPANRIEFYYETGRPDVRESYHEGSKTIVAHRLVQASTFIATTAGDREVNRLKLAHVVSPNTGRSLLASAQLCGGAGMQECMPKTEFTYTQGLAPVFESVSLSELALTRKDGSGRVQRGVYQGDFNGDGRQDLLVWDDEPASNLLLLSNGDGAFVTHGQPFPQATQIGHSNGCYYAVVADFNLDSIADVLQVQDPDARPGCASVPHLSRIYLGTSTGNFSEPVLLARELGAWIPLLRVDPRWLCQNTGQACEPIGTFGGRNYSLIDLNGDGWLDFLFTRTPPHGSDTYPTPCEPAELTCMLLGGPAVGRFTRVATNLAFKDLFSMGGIYALQGLPGYQSDRLYIGDLNGDGLADILLRDTGKVYVATSTPGQYSERQVSVPCAAGAEVMDINGDGKWDVACMDFSSSEPFRNYVNDGSGNFIHRSTVGGWTGNCTQLLTANGHEPVGCDPWAREWVNFIGADIDGDGISDVLSVSRRLRRHPGQYNAFLKGRPDGSYVSYPIPTLENDPFGYKESQFLVGDFTGKGALEILVYSPVNGDNRLLRRVDSMPADMLLTVTTAGNARTTIHYRPMTSKSVYERGFAAVYPNVDHIGSSWLVSFVEAPNGKGGVIATHYNYFKQIHNVEGRGPLGFRHVLKTAPGPDGTFVTQQTNNHQDYPLTGLPQDSYRFRPLLTGSSWTSLVESQYLSICDSPPAKPRVHRIVPSLTRERTRDPSGSYVGWVETWASGHNCFGDPSVVEVKTRQDQAATAVHTKRTESVFTYETSGDKWILGRLISARQINSIPVAAFPNPSTPSSSQPNNTPTVAVSMTPSNSELYVGQPSVRTWSTSNATSLTVTCTSAGGFTESASKSVNGSDTLVGDAAWLGKASNCTWQATGPGGARAATHTFTTRHPPPTISVQLSPGTLVPGQAYSVQWTSAFATSVAYSCSTGSASGYNASGTAPSTSGSVSGVAQASWVGHVSRCTWTATGLGGTKSFAYDMRTYPLPTITASVNPNPLRAGQTASLAWSSTNTTSVTYSCTALGTGFKQSGTVSSSGALALTAQAAWVGHPTTCSWVATGPSGTAQFPHSFSTIHAVPTVSVVMPPHGMTQTSIPITVSSTDATQVSAQCFGIPGTKTIQASVLNGQFFFGPDDSWAGFWTCVWTATGPGGSASTPSMDIIFNSPPPPDAGP